MSSLPMDLTNPSNFWKERVKSEAKASPFDADGAPKPGGGIRKPAEAPWAMENGMTMGVSKAERVEMGGSASSRQSSRASARSAASSRASASSRAASSRAASVTSTQVAGLKAQLAEEQTARQGMEAEIAQLKEILIRIGMRSLKTTSGPNNESQ